MDINADLHDTARDRLIVALDTPTVADAEKLVNQLGDSVAFYKIGLELAMQGGLSFISELKARGFQIFLDMKILDIPATVEKAVANAARTGADLLTVHAVDTKTMAAAARGAAGTGLKVLGVTVLTSLDEGDLTEQGIGEQPTELVIRRAKIAQAAGCHGVIASGREVAAVRAAVGGDFMIVTPGIRLPGNDIGDQARVGTPQSAIRDGANHLVVGRPITQASDPKAAAEIFLEEIEKAL